MLANMTNAKHVDINHGLDFERAQERLNNVAGRFFRAYLNIKKSPSATEQEKEAARNKYVDAMAQYKALKPTDTTTITEILRERDA